MQSFCEPKCMSGTTVHTLLTFSLSNYGQIEQILLAHQVVVCLFQQQGDSLFSRCGAVQAFNSHSTGDFSAVGF